MIHSYQHKSILSKGLLGVLYAYDRSRKSKVADLSVTILAD